MVIISTTAVFVALPAIKEDLNFDGDNLTWVVNSYALTFGGCLLLGGRSGDIFGRKRVFILGILLFSAASLLCGISRTQYMLLSSRALQGLGAALISPSALSILSTTYPDGQIRRRALAIWSATNACSGSIALLFGGAVTDKLSWPYTFILMVPLGSIAVVAAIHKVPNTRRLPDKTVDIGGATTVTFGATALVYAIISGRQNGWAAGITLGSLVTAFLLLTIFVKIQRSRRSPLVRLAIFRLRTLTVANITMCIVAGTSVTVIFLMTLYLQDVAGYSALKTGIAFLPITAAMLIGPLLADLLVARFEIRMVLLGALMLVAIGGSVMATVGPAGGFLTSIMPAMVLMHVGVGCATVILTLMATISVPEADLGTASGLINSSRVIGSALMLAILASAVSSLDDLSTRAGDAALMSGYRNAFWGVSIMAMLGVMIVIGLLRKQHVRSLGVRSK